MIPNPTNAEAFRRRIRNDGLLYFPDSGRMFRSANGRVRELQTSYWSNHDGRRKPTLIHWRGAKKPSTHVIWYLMTGEWPGEVVDHVDRNPANNRWSNLRLATRFQNAWNRDDSSKRWIGIDEGLERGVRKTAGGYVVVLGGAPYGTYATVTHANGVARRVRHQLYGSFDKDARTKLRRI